MFQCLIHSLSIQYILLSVTTAGTLEYNWIGVVFAAQRFKTLYYDADQTILVKIGINYIYAKQFKS